MVRHLPSEVTPLGSHALLVALGETQVSYRVLLVSIDADRLTVAEAPRLPLCSPVKVVLADRLWLGEVIQSSLASTVVEIVHSLVNLHALSEVADDITESGQPERALLS